MFKRTTLKVFSTQSHMFLENIHNSYTREIKVKQYREAITHFIVKYRMESRIDMSKYKQYFKSNKTIKIL